MDKGLVISAIILRLIIARFSYKCISRYSHTLILDFLYIFPKINVIQLQVDIKKKPGFQQNQTTCQFILYIGDHKLATTVSLFDL